MRKLNPLVEVKMVILKNAARGMFRRSRMEFLTLFFFLTGAGIGLYFFFLHGFRFFQEQKPFGPILLDETFYLFHFTLFVMLLVSSSVSAYTTLFKSSEVPFLLTRGIFWSEIYFMKLLEALWFSSWSFLFIAVPFLAALTLTKGISLAPIPFLGLIFYLPFVCLATMLGAMAAVFGVWIFPTRRRKKIALLIAAAGIVILFMRVQPEIIREQGSLAGVLSGYLPHVAFAKHPLLASSWVTKGILSFIQYNVQTGSLWNQGVFYFLVTLSNAMFLLIPSYWFGQTLYPYTYLKSQDLGEIRPARAIRIQESPIQWYDRLAWPSRPVMAFLEKDLKTFARDPSEWSQLIIFFGLLLVYFLNLKNLQFHVLKGFWRNLIFVLNTVGTYIVLSSFSMRCIFPMLSLEGSRAWIIGLSPIKFSSLLLEKFFLGLVVSALLTMPLVFVSGWMLDIPVKKIWFTTGLGFFVCVALTGLSVGLGTKFPNFKSNNPSEIISGLGGSLLLVLHLTYLIALGAFLLIPHGPAWVIFLSTATASLLIGTIPLQVGVNALKKMEF